MVGWQALTKEQRFGLKTTIRGPAMSAKPFVPIFEHLGQSEGDRKHGIKVSRAGMPRVTSVGRQ